MSIRFPWLEQAGRLGNQLWELASTLGIARAERTDPAFPSSWSYRPFFSVPDRYFEPAEGPTAEVFADRLDYRARRYLQDLGFWADVQHEVRAWFAPSSWAEALLDDLEVSNVVSTSISLHVRRGDNVYQTDYYWLPTVRYYQRALAALPRQRVVVFSDDIPWCQGQLWSIPELEGREVWFHEGVARPKEHEPGYMTAPVLDWQDLLLMARAPWHVISNSTYSWWGAWLSSDPAPIYPAAWYGPKIDFADPRRMFPPEWRMVEP